MNLIMPTRDVTSSRIMVPEDGNSGTVGPSSIFPMQLAPALSSSMSHKYPLGRETFSQLRQELLQGNFYNQFRSDENTKDVNKLICVVLKAGLENAIKGNSALSSEIEEQILDCLDIIQVAIEKAPHTLLENSDPEILGADVHAPLYAWLIIQLINFNGNWSQEHVEGRIRNLLSLIVHSQHKIYCTRCSRFSMSEFIRACATGRRYLLWNLYEYSPKLIFSRYTRHSRRFCSL
jgi:serine/threonine-protein kinase ATR